MLELILVTVLKMFSRPIRITLMLNRLSLRTMSKRFLKGKRLCNQSWWKAWANLPPSRTRRSMKNHKTTNLLISTDSHEKTLFRIMKWNKHRYMISRGIQSESNKLLKEQLMTLKWLGMIVQVQQIMSRSNLISNHLDHFQ